MPKKQFSKISIVGAGPGDPDLITLKGLRAIQNADAILYDALSSEKLLNNAKPGVELIYVGKRCGRHSLKQPDINALIRQMSLKHRHVVRLKGGDPFVFGRGHEELKFLSRYELEIEVVPGISSATALPLLQKVPLTRRNVAESFWVLTGTTKHHQLSRDISLAAKSSATVVILMGMRKLEQICSKFILAGKSEIPVMVIISGSTPKEEVVLGRVEDISEKVQDLSSEGPGIIIIGDVVRLHPSFVHQHATKTWA